MKNFLAGFGCAAIVFTVALIIRDEQKPVIETKNVQQTLHWLEMEEDGYVNQKLRDLNLKNSPPERVNVVFDSLAREYERRIAR